MCPRSRIDWHVCCEAPSTQLLLGDILSNKKKKKYPAGLGVTGEAPSYILLPDFADHASKARTTYSISPGPQKPLNKRYIRRFQHAPGGGLIIFTCYTSLLSLLDDPGVKAFEDNTTFKRVTGDLNEWEVVIFYNALEHAITLACAYIDCSDTKFFELLFDVFREIKIEATGKDIGFTRFMPNGNLLVMNADMEAAQALGAARSFLKTNVPSFSNITTLDPQSSATFFINPLSEFASLVNSEDYKQLNGFTPKSHVQDEEDYEEPDEGSSSKKRRPKAPRGAAKKQKTAPDLKKKTRQNATSGVKRGKNAPAGKPKPRGGKK
ncbi:hypothetical protein B0H13DRAFT_1851541 [Mycena leptocephala]|nr:hypothetical protein B0H13DRAFT_1851541 [Mycena leptocephala]